MSSRLLLTIVTLLSISVFSSPEDISHSNTWRINKDHSELFFQVPYLTIGHVTGRMTTFQGRLLFGQKTQLIKDVNIKISSNSIFTANSIRDGHLKSKDFLHSSRYPFITFTSQNITALEQGSYQAQGTLTIKGISATHTLNFKLSPLEKDSWGFANHFITFQTTINRRSYGITWNKSLKDSKQLVGDNIKLWGKIQIQPLRFATPGHKYMIPNTKYTKLKDQLLRGEITQEQFDDQVTIKAQAPRPLNKANSIVTQTNEPKTLSPLATSKGRTQEKFDRSFRESTLWWISYWIMGFIGLLATILLSMQSKYFVLKIWPDHYEENGKLGLFTDLIAYSIAFIYVWAMWYLGYG